MHVQLIKTIPGFDQWRDLARQCLGAQIHPNEVTWQCASDSNKMSLFSTNTVAVESEQTQLLPKVPFQIPREFISQAAIASCHSEPQRYALLYRILWRLVFENKALLHFQTDEDILRFTQMAKAVHRDAYKIKAFLRFREIHPDGKSHFVSWYEPEHYTLELVLPFFQTRFKNMGWSILTPYRAAHWDGNALTLTEAPDRSLCPTSDAIESYWLTYYANTFNPARVKTKAMLTQMPKKYWKNMPETAIISEILNNAEARVQKMLTHSTKGKSIF